MIFGIKLVYKEKTNNLSVILQFSAQFFEYNTLKNWKYNYKE
jgi:hypothetical protein